MEKKNLIITTKGGHQFRIHTDEVPNDCQGEQVAEILNRKYKGTDYEVIETREMNDEDIHGDWFINLPDDFGKLLKDDTETAKMDKQYRDLKAKHPDAMLLFRCGDFYETYYDDAERAADVLGITLTVSSKHKEPSGRGRRLAGFPYHALDTYLPKLIRAGVRVAICDQLEAPKTTTKRGITATVSQG